MACVSHPQAATYLGLCAACLLEQALPSNIDNDGTRNLSLDASSQLLSGATSLTVQLPLGSSASASIFLVQNQNAEPHLLRLKRWHKPAPVGFLPGFARLVAQFAGWNHDEIAVPSVAGIDKVGRPWMLSEFRQGLPLLESVTRGRLSPDAAAAVLVRLLAVTRRAHSRGLTHGSIVPGNVIVHPKSGSAYLLDFGLAPLLADSTDHRASVSSDLTGFAALERALRQVPRDRSAPEL